LKFETSHFRIKNVAIFDPEMESVTGCHAEMLRISRGKAKQRFRLGRQIKTAWMRFWFEIRIRRCQSVKIA
jgi:predicted amino acid dehydrogenase